MNAILTTHVLDTAHGRPAAGMRIDLFRITPSDDILVTSVVTNSDGRTAAPLLDTSTPGVIAGNYQLLFHVADYFAAIGHKDAGRFLHQVPVAFVLENTTQKLHVPLLVSPWAYSTYRGS